MYHFRVRVIGRKGKRKSVAVSAAAYRSRSLLYDYIASRWVNYSHKQDLCASFIIAPKGSPAWVFDRERLWNEVEKNEKRVDSQVCRELEISLPRVFNTDRSVRVITDYVTKNCVELGMVADISIHGIGSENPHAHVLLTMRKIDPNGKWGKKATEWNKYSLVNQMRKDWENTYNLEVEAMGMPQLRVSCESNKARGIDKNPQKYCGPRRIRLWREEGIIEPESAQYVIDQLKKEDDELQRQIEFLSLQARRAKRRAGQMLNESLAALAGARSNLAISVHEPKDHGLKIREFQVAGMADRLTALENLNLEPVKSGAGIKPGPGFG